MVDFRKGTTLRWQYLAAHTPMGLPRQISQGTAAPTLRSKAETRTRCWLSKETARGAFPPSQNDTRSADGPSSADLNHDRRADIVVTNTDGSSVSVLLADAGGGLEASKTIGIAEAPFAVAIGDVNGDTHPDLVIAHRRGSMKQNDLDGLT